MSETTATRTPRQRRKPQRFARLVTTDGRAVLVIRQPRPKSADLLDCYTVEAFPSHLGERGVALTKPDGTVYHVNLDGRASTCSCPGFESHGWHKGPDGELTACKHVMSLLALQRAGRL